MSGPYEELPILPVGTQVVMITDQRGPAGGVRVPRGAVGVVLEAPTDAAHAYWVRLADGVELGCKRHDLATLARWQDAELGRGPQLGGRSLFDRVILRVAIGSRAYGLEVASSDTDRRGVYLPAAEMHWSLYGVPEQIDDEGNQETYWELQKLLVMGLKANPNVLECLWSPLVEFATPLGRELLALRSSFLSRLVFQTYSGYVLSQFRKIEADLRQHGAPKWKHVMHLLRLLQAGIGVLTTGEVPVHVGDRRERLLAVRRGEVAWAEIEVWQKELQTAFALASATTSLPERPDYARVDAFLRRARRLALAGELP